ncbi:hypothetical protein DUNSADRAFT_2584, partial [Dunaliella salina]
LHSFSPPQPSAPQHHTSAVRSAEHQGAVARSSSQPRAARAQPQVTSPVQKANASAPTAPSSRDLAAQSIGTDEQLISDSYGAGGSGPPSMQTQQSFSGGSSNEASPTPRPPPFTSIRPLSQLPPSGPLQMQGASDQASGQEGSVNKPAVRPDSRRSLFVRPGGRGVRSAERSGSSSGVREGLQPGVTASAPPPYHHHHQQQQQQQQQQNAGSYAAVHASSKGVLSPPAGAPMNGHKSAVSTAPSVPRPTTPAPPEGLLHSHNVQSLVEHWEENAGAEAPCSLPLHSAHHDRSHAAPFDVSFTQSEFPGATQHAPGGDAAHGGPHPAHGEELDCWKGGSSEGQGAAQTPSSPQQQGSPDAGAHHDDEGDDGGDGQGLLELPAWARGGDTTLGSQSTQARLRTGSSTPQSSYSLNNLGSDCTSHLGSHRSGDLASKYSSGRPTRAPASSSLGPGTYHSSPLSSAVQQQQRQQQQHPGWVAPTHSPSISVSKYVSLTMQHQRAPLGPQASFQAEEEPPHPRTSGLQGPGSLAEMAAEAEAAAAAAAGPHSGPPTGQESKNGVRHGLLSPGGLATTVSKMLADLAAARQGTSASSAGCGGGGGEELKGLGARQAGAVAESTLPAFDSAAGLAPALQLPTPSPPPCPSATLFPPALPVPSATAPTAAATAPLPRPSPPFPLPGFGSISSPQPALHPPLPPPPPQQLPVQRDVKSLLQQPQQASGSTTASPPPHPRPASTVKPTAPSYCNPIHACKPESHSTSSRSVSAPGPVSLGLYQHPMSSPTVSAAPGPVSLGQYQHPLSSPPVSAPGPVLAPAPVSVCQYQHPTSSPPVSAASGALQRPALLSLRSPPRIPYLCPPAVGTDALLAGTEARPYDHLHQQALSRASVAVPTHEPAGVAEEKEAEPRSQRPPAWLGQHWPASRDSPQHTSMSVRAGEGQGVGGARNRSAQVHLPASCSPQQPLQGLDYVSCRDGSSVPLSAPSHPSPVPSPQPLPPAVAPLRVPDLLRPLQTDCGRPSGIDLNGVPYFSTYDVLHKSPGKF